MRNKNLEKALNSTWSKGFTLIEVLIGLAIFSIGILGVAAMQISATNGNSLAGRITSNMTWAFDRVEELMALPYTDAALSAGNHSVTALNLTTDSDGIDNDSDGEIDEAGETGNISMQWTVTDDMPMNRTKTIQITVTRTGPRGLRTVTLTQVIPEII
jgi:prepilin-type N-terminal cleavage/methylation domain-containing protein